MGDNGEMYPSMPREFIELYRDGMVPLATMVTPNQTEAQYEPILPINQLLVLAIDDNVFAALSLSRLLTGVTITSLADARRVCSLLHARGPRAVVITSFHLPAAAVVGAARAAATDCDDASTSAPPVAPAELLVMCSERVAGTGSGVLGMDEAVPEYRQHVFAVPQVRAFITFTIMY